MTVPKYPYMYVLLDQPSKLLKYIIWRLIGSFTEKYNQMTMPEFDYVDMPGYVDLEPSSISYAESHMARRAFIEPLSSSRFSWNIAFVKSQYTFH